MKQRQRGFGVVEVIVIVITVIVVAGVGFLAYKNFSAAHNDQNDGYTTAGTESMDHTVENKAINNTADLDAAAASVDDSSFENDGTTDLDSELSNF